MEKEKKYAKYIILVEAGHIDRLYRKLFYVKMQEGVVKKKKKRQYLAFVA